MSAMNVGFATVTVAPSFKGFQAAVGKETKAVFPAAGKAGGASYGKAVAQGFKDGATDLKKQAADLEKKVFSAQDQLKKSKAANKTATDAETKASGELRVAELKLAEARDGGNTKASALAKAENDLAEKQRKSADASEKASDSQDDLKKSVENLETSEKELKTATDKANDEIAQTPKDAKKAEKGLKGLQTEAKKTGSVFGKLGKAMKKGLAVGATALVAGGLATLGAGASRAMNIEESKAQMMGSKSVTQADVDQASEDAMGSVTGTAYGFDEAMTSASGFMAAGVETGKELSGVLSLTSDMAFMAGTSMGDMGSILGKVAAKGKLDGEVMAQLTDAGIAVLPLLAKHYGVSAEEAQKMVSEGKVSFAEFRTVMEKDVGGAAQKSGETTKGAFANMKAAFSRLGESIMVDVLPLFKGFFNGVNETISERLIPAMKVAVEWIKVNLIPAFKTYAEYFKAVILPQFQALGDFITNRVVPALQAFGGWVVKNKDWLIPLGIALAGMAGALFLMWEGFQLFLRVKAIITAVKVAFALLNTTMLMNPIVLIVAAVVGLVAAFIYLWNTNEGFRNFFIQAWENIKAVAMSVWDAIKGAIVGAWEGYIKPVFDALVGFIQNTLVPIFQWLYTNIILPIWNGIKLAIGIVVTIVISYIKLWVWVFKEVLVPAVLWVWNSVLKPTFNAIGTFFKWVWEKLLKPAFDAVVVAFKAVGTALKWVWDTVLKPTFKALGDFFKWVWEKLLKPAFDAVKWGFNLWVTAVKFYWNNILKPVFKALGDFFVWVWTKVLRPAFNAVKDAFKAVGTFISNIWNNNIKPIFTALGDFISEKIVPAFEKGVDMIKSAWEKVANIARKPINFVIKTVYGGLADTFNNVAKNLGLDEKFRLPPAKEVPEFYAGGYTGPGAKYQEAGIVHADEFVVQKSSQRSISRAAPGFLDSLNRFGAKALGYANGGLVKPTKGGTVTSRFGASRGRYPHAGIDFAVPTGTPVFASMAGTVQKAGNRAINGRTGIGAFLGHEGNRNTYYGHLSRLLVGIGDQVKRGQQIALSGNTGNSTGPHLHFETWTGGKPVNPEAYLNGAELPSGGVGGGMNPLQGLFDLKDKMVGKFKGMFGEENFINKMASGSLSKIISGPLDWIKEKAAAIGDFGQDVWGNTKDLFNGKDSGVQAAVRGVANDFGWGSGRHWDSISKIIAKESSWNPNAANPNSTARGLFQKMESYHGKVEGTPEGQARWGLKYIKDRYGDPEKAWAFHKRNGSYADGGLVKPTLYDNGGILTPGLTQVQNLTKKPEAILTNEQWKSISSLAVSKTVGGYEINVSVPNPGATGPDIADSIFHAARVNNRSGR